MPRTKRELAKTEHESASDDNLESALKACREAARRGYEIAKENLRESEKAISDVSKSLSQCLAARRGVVYEAPCPVLPSLAFSRP